MSASPASLFFGTTAVDGRSGRIYLALPATVFDINGHAINHLLSCWRGEAIYWRYADDRACLDGRLRSLGTPTIVTALLDLSDSRQYNTASMLARLFVGTGLGLADPCGDRSDQQCRRMRERTQPRTGERAPLGRRPDRGIGRRTSVTERALCGY